MADDTKKTDAGGDADSAPHQRLADLAEKLPEKDAVQKAVKEGMLAPSGSQKEAKAKAKVVDESPDAPDTPSGHALKKAAGISDDVKRGEEYLRQKSLKRHGYEPVES